MEILKEYCTCSLCKKEVRGESSNFNRHIGIHYNPIGRNCRAWYKEHFKKDQGVCVCVYCDEEFYHENKDGVASSEQYVQHLKEKHSIVR